MKNALLMFLSEIHLKNERLSYTEYKTDKYGKIQCYQTNAASVKYLMKKLEEKGERIDYIFAFSTDTTQDKIEYIDNDGNTITKEMQREIFEEDIVTEYPQLDGCISYVYFDEDFRADRVVEFVLNMVDSMRPTMKENFEDWMVHCDLTGGIRPAAVLMMSVLHLLKYSGIKIGEAVYANYNSTDQSRNKIDEVSNIHRMFELVSSTDSCLNNASLREIEHYFEQFNTSTQMQKLLKALRNFSDAVKVCRTGKFESSLQELSVGISEFKKHIEECKDSETMNMQEELFFQVLDRLEGDYGVITKPGVSQLDIIRWCINKDFLQQAMTLFTEWIPGEIVRLKIMFPSTEFRNSILEHCKNNNAGYKGPSNVFVNEYRVSNLDGKKVNVSEIKKFYSETRAFFKTSGKGKYPENVDNNLLNQLVQEIDKTDTLKNQIKNNKKKWGEVLKDYPLLIECVQAMQDRDQHYRDMSTSNVFISKLINTEKVYKFLFGASNDFLKEFLHYTPKEVEQREEKHKKVNNSEETIAEKWKNRWLEVEYMLKNHVIETDVSEDDFMHILEGLHWVRQQRNQINHAANDKDVADNDQLKSRMLETIELMENTVKVV